VYCICKNSDVLGIPYGTAVESSLGTDGQTQNPEECVISTATYMYTCVVLRSYGRHCIILTTTTIPKMAYAVSSSVAHIVVASDFWLHGYILSSLSNGLVDSMCSSLVRATEKQKTVCVCVCSHKNRDQSSSIVGVYFRGGVSRVHAPCRDSV
jgi:hypothetical protein